MDSANQNSTGERFIPGQGSAELHHEHHHRYLLAADFAHGIVVDVACGEGYGAGYLAIAADRLIGVDRASDVVATAQKKYGSERVSFIAADAHSLPIVSGGVDVTVSFETVEHLDDADLFIRELKRILRPGGILIISTPNKAEYSDRTEFQNPFHTHEFYLGEFRDLLRQYFREVTLIGQRPVGGSILWTLPDLSDRAALLVDRSGNSISPMYVLAVCSDASSLRSKGQLQTSVFIDHGVDLVDEYHEQIGAVDALQEELDAIHGSGYWKVLTALSRVRQLAFPDGTLRGRAWQFLKALPSRMGGSQGSS